MGADAPGSINGINGSADELLTLRMNFDGESNFGGLLTLLDTSEMRIAEHVQGVGPSIYSVWETTVERPSNPVPLPASVWLLGSGFASWYGGGAIRRRKKRN